MGRHSSPDEGPFYRSIAAWFLPWAVMAAIAGAAVWVGVDALAGGDVATGVKREDRPNAPAATVSPTAPRPTRQPEATAQQAQQDVTPTSSPSLITSVTVQVLDGASSPDAASAMADRLRGLGFEVVAVETAARRYDETTVLWSHDAVEEAAKALAARFGWRAEPQPGNLSSAVDLHVVVGLDAA